MEIRQSSEIDILNRQIGSEYVTIDGHKIFRLVWSESIFENRYGTFREFSESGLFIREVTEVKKVRKYNYIHNRWIFEAWAPGNITANPETPDAINGDYVPVYVFEDGGGNYLPPNEKVVRFLIANFYGRVKKDEVPSEEYLEQREIGRTIESMDDHPSWFQTRPGAARNAIWYSGGIPKWHQRRATFSDESFIQEQALKDIEAEAKERARQRAMEEKQRIREARLLEQQVEEERQREYEREIRKEAKIAQELEREQEFVEHQPTPEPIVITKSPMHRG